MKRQLFLKISVLKNFANFSGKQEKEAPLQVFSSRIFKSIFFYRTTLVAAF